MIYFQSHLDIFIWPHSNLLGKFLYWNDNGSILQRLWSTSSWWYNNFRRNSPAFHYNSNGSLQRHHWIFRSWNICRQFRVSFSNTLDNIRSTKKMLLLLPIFWAYRDQGSVTQLGVEATPHQVLSIWQFVESFRQQSSLRNISLKDGSSGVLSW